MRRKEHQTDQKWHQMPNNSDKNGRNSYKRRRNLYNRRQYLLKCLILYKRLIICQEMRFFK
jgi:hypothetical protein